MSDRITIKCYACQREFSKLVPKEKQKGEMIVHCPFSDCKVESKIVFDSSDIVWVYKSKKIKFKGD